ncbi:hypothetical protein [Flagellimonas amoyensis]|uniref:hypothetical protein n=1 Tax=Flagellimonas amoyensis TaxID=2169401 RepID=UPI000D350973|nr:hypothetical protein [Allomuricauda amoyensis]
MKYQNQKYNPIDFLVDKLVDTFAKVKDFDKLQESEEGKKLFDLIIKSITEMENFQILFLNYYIPSANKSIADSWNQLKTSKYKHFLNISKEDLKENLYETIRLGYVGLFHKYESYLKALVDATDFLFRDLREENGFLTIQDYCKKEFGINKITNSHHHFNITKRVNYISNAIKHNDGFHREEIHPDFINPDIKKRIEVNKETFKIDIERMKIHCQNLQAQMATIYLKQFLDLDYEIIKESIKPELKESIKTKEKLMAEKKNMESILSDFRR